MKTILTTLMKMVCFSLFSLFPSLIFGQNILWEKSYGGKHAEYLMDAKGTADYGFILAGSSLSKKTGNKAQDNKGDLDYWIWKMDESGEMNWQKSFGGTGTDMLQSIYLTRDGGFILAGTSNSDKGLDKQDVSRGQEDFWIIKLNAGGGEEWEKTIGGSGQEKLQSISQTKDGGYIIAGSSASDKSGEKNQDSFGNMDYWVVKLDNMGKIEWQKTIGGIFYDELRSIEQTNDGGYILGGYSNSPSGGNKTDNCLGVGDYWIVKLDPKGSIDWQKTLGGDKDDQLNVIHQTYDGGYVLGGNSNSGSNNSKTVSNRRGTDFWVVKLDVDGVMQWQETYDFGKTDILTSMSENDDHTILIGGFAKSETEFSNKKEDEGINDYIALKITEKGEKVWDKTVGSAGDDILKKLIETRDGGYLLAGTSNPVPIKRNVNTTTKKGGSGVKVGNSSKNNEQLSKTTDAINDQINETTKEVNDAYNEQAKKLTDGVNDALNPNTDARFKTGLNLPNSPLNSPMSMGGGDGSGADLLGSALGGQKTTGPASKDKSTNYGNKDFWVVKLKDKNKHEKPKTNVEAFPNPATSYTNVIIGYEYNSGTATLVDMAGHVLKQFKITDRTIPIDLSSYPEGIYVVNIKTDKGNDGIKIMKGLN